MLKIPKMKVFQIRQSIAHFGLYAILSTDPAMFCFIERERLAKMEVKMNLPSSTKGLELDITNKFLDHKS